MSLSACIFMFVAWTSILGLTFWCVDKMIRSTSKSLTRQRSVDPEIEFSE